MNGQCIVTKPADPEKLRKYLATKPYRIKNKLNNNKYNKMTLEQARYITEMRLAKQLRDMF